MTRPPVVVGDTGPINYLILNSHINVLPVLFGMIALPSLVRDELAQPKTPLVVRNWTANPPAWLNVLQPTQATDASLADLDSGEKAAITLAIEIHADLLLMDDRRGVRAARGKGFRVAGTLAILSMAARRDLLDLADAFDRLKRTSFHCSQEIMDQFLAEQRDKT